MDLVGRRPLLLSSQALMLPFLSGLVLYFGLTSGPEPAVCDASRLGWLAVVRISTPNQLCSLLVLSYDGRSTPGLRESFCLLLLSTARYH